MFQGFWLRWAAKRYAAKLPRQISKSFGSKPSYNELQIRRAVELAGLDARHIALAFARYMTGPDFALLMGPKLDYAALRAVFMEYEPVEIASSEMSPLTIEHHDR